MRSTKSLVGWVAVMVGVAASSSTHGAGFALIEHSGRAMGQAFAGATVGTEDSSCIYFNPAGLSDLAEANLVIGAHVIRPSFRFGDEGSGYPALGGLPLTGGEGGDGGVDVLVPNLYYARRMSDQLVAGLGVHSPFGLTTEYDAGWIGRYQGIRTELRTLHINPSAAWKLSDRIAVGAGLSAAYIEAELSSAVDFGSLLAAQGVAGAVPQALDGRAEVEGDDWGLGFNAGLLAAPTESSRVGLAYRSSIRHTLEGDATFRVPAPARALQTMGLFVDSGATAEVELPETVSLGASQKICDALTLLADVAWTRWSRFEELRVEYDSAQPDSVTEENWDDTWRYAVGVRYARSDKWTLRAGTAYDQTPVPDRQHRTPRIPDADRLWLAFGGGYRVTEDVALDWSYVRLFMEDAEVDHTGPAGDRLVGTYEGKVDIFSVQLTWNL